ncbi:protein HESO1-like isoform X2 [Salvia splendens]|uniref:protein HESO1-like isoform X2 n=1 Tax=Salvia splendens TaxID=180675 RepID=UPI001C26F295|nr:protein HESO1-like isoform X2 [Salvia splendens]
MNGYNPVEQTVNEILRAINPSKEDWTIRFHIINEVRAVIESIESLRGATVEPYGSFVSNLFTKWGDVDISIELPNGSYISSPGRKHKQSLLADIIKALRKKGGYRRLKFISNARVPIVKFEGNFNISCDLSVNNLSGQMKSKILFWITGIDSRFRDLVLLVKEWAKTHHINDSKSGTLNSYCLSLLVLFHFQTLKPAILPPLVEIYPGNMADDLTGVRAVAEKNIEDTCAVNIKKIWADRSRAINRSSLSELFLSFLAKVEDPFEQPANTARAVSSDQLIKIAEAIQVTRQMLVSPNQNQASLFSVLVGPHVSWLERRASVSTSTMQQYTSASISRNAPFNRNTPISSNGVKTRPERKQQPLQTLQKSRNKVMDKPQNGESNGSDHASTSQKQQVWRPRSEPKAENNSSGD